MQCNQKKRRHFAITVLAVFKLDDSWTGQGPRALLQSVAPWLGALPTPLADICVEQHDSSTGAQIHIVLIQHVTGKMKGVFEKPSKYFKKYIYLYKFHHLLLLVSGFNWERPCCHLCPAFDPVPDFLLFVVKHHFDHKSYSLTQTFPMVDLSFAHDVH